ncbi:alginate export family protein [Chitinophaga sp. sic0106]|uniref:alginate export family protein n=1 Tax=Chitinophaga sp. sic0106 TaxID=2854785 RepID=UPI001C441520|nr:alginate export family protein [Chitinophaga sp. sic0106]MBV7531809.1 alginate export family protein [Chitinophaga sp. sic0106]
MKSALLITIAIFTGCAVSSAQQMPAFKPLRYDEDYSLLKTDTTPTWYEKMKYTPLSGNSAVSFGGEVRFQYFFIQNEAWGEEPKDEDGYTLSRFLFHTDIRLGKWFRAFAQLQSSMANSKPATSPVDEDPLELHQAFAELHMLSSAQKNLVVRLGRQELMYGSQRLVSVRESPNNRQSFDAARVLFNSGNYNLETFYGNYVAAKKGIFNDGFNKHTSLWGAYATRHQLPLLQNIDLYYLGLRKDNAIYNDGSGKEIRHSAGARIWNSKRKWLYDVEGLYQFGNMGGKSISAWTTSVNTSYQFTQLTLKPTASLKAEIVSGDAHKGDHRLQTFNPLFPKGAYFGLAALIGPSNLMDIHPGVTLQLNRQLTFDMDYDIFWRHRSTDGIYAVNMALIYPDGDTPEKHIGKQLTGAFNYNPNNFISLRAEFTWFDAGKYLKLVGPGKDIIFTGFTAQCRF